MRTTLIMLFDEIEKAHSVVWSSLLGLLDEGAVTLDDNRTTDMTRAVVLMTSNVGSRDLASRQLEAEDAVEIVLEDGALAFYRKRPSPNSAPTPQPCCSRVRTPSGPSC